MAEPLSPERLAEIREHFISANGPSAAEGEVVSVLDDLLNLRAENERLWSLVREQAQRSLELRGNLVEAVGMRAKAEAERDALRSLLAEVAHHDGLDIEPYDPHNTLSLSSDLRRRIQEVIAPREGEGR